MTETVTMVVALAVLLLLIWGALVAGSRNRVRAMQAEQDHQEQVERERREQSAADRLQARTMLYRREISQRGLEAHRKGLPRGSIPSYEEWARAKGYQDGVLD